eukprot:3340565-Pyramimonas_sp.AAC.3
MRRSPATCGENRGVNPFGNLAKNRRPLCEMTCSSLPSLGGAELKALRGMTGTSLRCIPHVGGQHVYDKELSRASRSPYSTGRGTLVH